MKNKRFKVALSFAGENRDYVSQVANFLAEELGESSVFYDAWHKEKLAVLNMDTHLQNIYSKDSQLLIPFLSSEYKEKPWCGLEWRAMRELIKKRKDDEIMFLRFDDAEIEGLFSIDGYIDLNEHTPKQISEFIIKRWKSLNDAQPENNQDSANTVEPEIPTQNQREQRQEDLFLPICHLSFVICHLSFVKR